MTATIAFIVAAVAIFIGAVWIVRVELSKPDPLDYCDAAASEPMPLEKPVKHVRGNTAYGEQV